MAERIGGRTGFGPGGQVTNAFLAMAEQTAGTLGADGPTERSARTTDDGILHVPTGTVCMACFRTMTAHHAARRSPYGWRHESCP